MASNLYDLDSVIDEKVNQLIKGSFDKVEGKTPNTGQVIIRFYDGKLLKGRKLSGGSVDTGGGGGGWFSAGASTTSKTNDNAWELWTITVECLPIEEHKEASSGSTKEINGNIKLSIKSFEDNLNQIFTTVDTHKDHIPPITSTASVTFPYTITIDTGIPPRISAEEVTSSQPPPPSTTMGQWWK
ncbi:uncharacterized protein RJT21DRAFT_114725 [Scheffersomyces amazonensis]|uniref:uncharacterized protein n=1 Tax=Scheffersomyces amazonensis TaxID=1078765 RepID=UPI00315CCA37